jgi:hypothetical protein
VLVGTGLVVTLLTAVIVAGVGKQGTLDPNGYDPTGAHALAVLLRQQGVDLERTTDVPSTVEAADAQSTVFVPLPQLMSPEELSALSRTQARLVVAEADGGDLAALGVRADVTGGEDPKTRPPGCSDPVARNAGRALTGGYSYSYQVAGGVACYRTPDGASLLLLGRVTLLGAADPLTNEHLDEQGNAALGIGLLGHEPRLVWLVPSTSRAEFGQRPLISPEDLVPHWLHLERWQLLVTVLVAALWRGRRLGRVVVEQLPAVVRASETVEGHGRLAQAAGARDTSAASLREAARTRLSRLAHGGTLEPDALVGVVAARTGQDAGSVRSLLYGPTPADDAALVRLARELDALVRAALTREGAPT